MECVNCHKKMQNKLGYICPTCGIVLCDPCVNMMGYVCPKCGGNLNPFA